MLAGLSENRALLTPFSADFLRVIFRQVVLCAQDTLAFAPYIHLSRKVFKSSNNRPLLITVQKLTCSNAHTYNKIQYINIKTNNKL